MAALLGWAGAILLSICGAPQAFQSWQQGNSDGISSAFLLMWGWGEVFTLGYVITKVRPCGALILNYSVNLFFILVILYFKLFPVT